jgi:hypothetical protein
MLWAILELASYLSKQKKYSFLSPLFVAAVVGLVRLRRNLCASGASPDQQPSKISAVVGRKNQCERVRLWRNLSAYGGWSLSAQNHTNIGRKNKSMSGAGAESCSSRLSRDVTCPPLAELVRLWRNLCASGASPDQQHCMMDISPQSIPLISE